MNLDDNVGLLGLPICGIQIKATLTNGLAHVELMQRFVNTNDFPIETEYVFPLDDSIAMSEFKILTEGKVLEGVLKKKEKAEQSYSDTIASGGTAYMASIDPKDNTMHIQFGNISPGKDFVITLVFEKVLTVYDNCWYFALASKLLIGPIEFAITILSPSKLSRCVCRSHKVKPIYDQSCLKADLNYKSLDKNTSELVVYYRNASFNIPSGIVQKAANHKDYAISVSLIPVLDEENDPHIDGVDEDPVKVYKKDVSMPVYKGEHIFLLDYSGSMCGTPIQLAREALIIFLKSLPETSFFNIYIFGSSFEKAFPSSVEYNKKNLDFAINYLSNIRELGGTDILQPLQDVVKTSKTPGFIRNVYMLTDGCVDDKERTLDLIKMNNSDTIVHAIGIGNGVDENLIKQSGKFGKGESELINDLNDISSRIITLLIHAMSSKLVNARVEWPNGMNIKMKTDCKDVYGSNTLNLFALSENVISGPVRIFGTDCRTGKEQTLEGKISGDAIIEGNHVYKLAANSILKEDKALGNHLIEELSLTYGVLSSVTNFIVTEKGSKACRKANGGC